MNDHHFLDGLAQLIQHAAPDSINSDDLVNILRVLHKRLQATHPQAVSSRYQLLLVVSRILDAMVDANIGDVDRINLHEPLTDLLRVSESSKDPYLSFEAAYAMQALLNVSDDESIWHAGFRRVWLVLTVGAAFAKVPDPREIKDALEGMRKAYDAGKRATNTLKDALETIKTGGRAEFTVEEGLKFKLAWYRALRTAELYIQTGKLVYFKDLVTTTHCRHHRMFQLGICQLLGQFAADTRWELEARQSAVAFIEALYRADSIWNREKDVDQVIFDVLTNLVSNYGTHFEAAKILLEEMRKQNTALKQIANPHSPRNNIQARYPARPTPPKGVLLKAVQIGPDMEDIQSALKTYYAPNLSILRVSRESLPLETCFVNLAIVEAPTQREKEKQDLKEQAAIFHRIPSSEVVQGANLQSSIPLEQLFDKRKLRDGKEDVPRRILVQGRAGIGKTTLCKKLVHAHQAGLFSDRFDAVLWLPLRELKAFKSRTLESLLHEKYFSMQGLDNEGAALAHALATCARKGKVLFILDGLDEIVADTKTNEGITLKEFLTNLLNRQHVVITSRPSGLDKSLLPPIDLELETIGFSQQNVNEFLVKVLEPGAVATVQDFIRRTPLIQGLINIPVQLDVICFCWDDLLKDDSPITMTRLYQQMVRNLWRKDADRLNKKRGGARLTKKHLNEMDREEIDELMNIEVQHLGYLAFKGMTNNYQIGFHQADLLGAFKDLKAFRTTLNNDISLPQLVDEMKKTSFLHTPETDLDPRKQAWNFLHLTFQEYFAATWIARQLRLNESYLSAGTMKEEPTIAFVHKHKYNPRYEIVWWMVAGLLEDEALTEYFRLFQETPRDLIGGRHQQLLASCLNEARDRLDHTVVTRYDAELKQWMNFEIQMLNSEDGRSLLGCRDSFPEHLLVEQLEVACSWKRTLVETLGNRSTLSESAIQLLVDTLQDPEAVVRKSAADALGKQSTLSESTIQPLVDALLDECDYVRWPVAMALGKQSALSESAIQSLIGALEDEHEFVRQAAAFALGKQSTLSESTIQSLIGALEDEHEHVRDAAASALGNQSTLPGSAIQSLVDALLDECHYVRVVVAIALGKQSTLPGSAIQSLI
ncbi:hypothetical protein BGX33_000204, partial [Mortierella sp. NVP41]